MRIGLFLLSVAAPLAVGLLLLLSLCLELSSRLRRSRNECKKLKADRDLLRLEVDAIQKRAAESHTRFAGDSSHQLATNPDAFAKLRALVIKTLHPDGTPPDRPDERELRSDMFKAVWPEIIKIENEVGDQPNPQAHDIIKNDRRRPVTVADLGKVNSQEPMHGWRRGSDRGLGGGGGWRERRRTEVHD